MKTTTCDETGATINGVVPYYLVDNELGRTLEFRDMAALKAWAAKQP